MDYVDDLLLIGTDSEIQTFLKTLEAQLQLKHVTKLQRNKIHHIAMGMTEGCCNTQLKLYKMQENTNALSTTGNRRPPIEEELFNT
eukprot:1697154-Amphidinium_carterae.3